MNNMEKFIKLELQHSIKKLNNSTYSYDLRDFREVMQFSVKHRDPRRSLNYCVISYNQSCMFRLY